MERFIKHLRVSKIYKTLNQELNRTKTNINEIYKTKN